MIDYYCEMHGCNFTPLVSSIFVRARRCSYKCAPVYKSVQGWINPFSQSDFAIRTSHCPKLRIVLIASRTRAASGGGTASCEKGDSPPFRKSGVGVALPPLHARVVRTSRQFLFSLYLADALTVSHSLTAVLAHIPRPKL